MSSSIRARLSSHSSEISPQSSVSQRGAKGRYGFRRADPVQHEQLGKGEADGYYDPNQTFATVASNTSDPTSHNDTHVRIDSQDSEVGQHRRHRHHHRRPISYDEHEYFIARSTLPPGLLGYLKGTFYLLLRRRFVREDTPERLDLLSRADYYFNDGIVGRVPGLSREKEHRFRAEMDAVTKTLLAEERHRMRGQRRTDHSGHQHDRFGLCRA